MICVAQVSSLRMIVLRILANIHGLQGDRYHGFLYPRSWQVFVNMLPLDGQNIDVLDL